jgi:RecA/RadA recombinase
MEKSPRTVPVDPRNLLSTGSTLFNLALSGHARGGWLAGSYNLFVGDSSSGKTFLAITALAEACYNKRFKDYALVYDAVEDGALMEVARFFGPRLAARLEPPARDSEGEELHSHTIEDFYFNLYNRLSQGPCIYVEDSMDALSSKAEQSKFQERRKASSKGEAALKNVKGDYGMDKAKINSGYIRQIRPLLRDTGSILVIISQTRDNVDPFGYETRTRAGGRAMKFYAHTEAWTKRVGTHRAKYGEMDLQTGIVVQIDTRKNRLSGKEWSIQVPIYHTYGVDDIGSCIDFLVKVKRWAKADKGGIITATDFELKGTREKLVGKIEQADRTRELKGIVEDAWKEMEDHVAIKRKPRYE